jgi:hypothetical protein
LIAALTEPALYPSGEEASWGPKAAVRQPVAIKCEGRCFGGRIGALHDYQDIKSYVLASSAAEWIQLAKRI